ncbi:beta-galactosidase 8-like protein, partial [Trifolium pratense]
AAVYNTGSVCAAFLANVDTKSDKTVNFSGNSYHLPAWSVSILPDCKNVVLNTAKINSASAISSFVTERSKEDIEQIYTTADRSDYLWYTLSVVDLKDDPGSQTVLHIESLGHSLHAFIIGKLAGNQAGNSGKAKLNVELQV